MSNFLRGLLFRKEAAPQAPAPAALLTSGDQLMSHFREGVASLVDREGWHIYPDQPWAAYPFDAYRGVLIVYGIGSHDGLKWRISIVQQWFAAWGEYDRWAATGEEAVQIAEGFIESFTCNPSILDK